MTIKCIAIDDEPLALRQLVSYISKVSFLELVAQCHSAVDARKVLDDEPVDAIFTDINMPELNGMDFIKQLSVPPLVVFTTAYSDYAVEGFRVDAVDYLLKPFGFQDFIRAANRLKERMLPHPTAAVSVDEEHTGDIQETDSMFVKTDYRTVRITIADIRYVEGMSEYLKLHVENEAKPIITLLSMKILEQRLPRNFMRIHRSYIVNLDKILEVNKNRVILDANTYLPIGDSYKEQFNEYLESRFLGK